MGARSEFKPDTPSFAKIAVRTAKKADPRAKKSHDWTPSSIAHKGKRLSGDELRDDLLPWLTEQFDRAERKETWSLTMEFAITVFVLAELMLSLVHLFK